MDRLGTFKVETNASQSVTGTRTYDAFGNPMGTTGTPTTPFGFAAAWGYQQDPDSGLMLLGHRYYDPSTGRFLTRDPAKDGRNWYGYCANNPIKWVDPPGYRLYDSLLAVGTWIDNNLLGGAVGDAGDAYGQWEAGTGSGWVALGKGLKAIALIAVLAVTIESVGAGLVGESGAGAMEGELEARTAAVREKVPSGWIESEGDSGGAVFRDPNNPHTSVRYDPPSSKAGYDHVHVNDGGRIIGRGGVDASGADRFDPVRHIPFEEWNGWRTWNSL